MSEPIKLNVGITTPSLTDTVTVNGGPQDLTGATVKLRVRPNNSATLKVNSTASITNATGGRVQYDWGVADLDTEGEYRAWWFITLSGGRIFETPEFAVIVDAHAPGFGVTTGVLAQRVREHIPIAYHALVNDERYGEPTIQSRVDMIKFKLFATIVDPALEATVYDRFLQEYVGKLSTLALIPAAADYWSDRLVQEGTTGTNENVQYPDRIDAIWRLHERLLLEVKEMDPLVTGIIRRNKGRFPTVSTTGPLKSPNPADFPPEYGKWPVDNLPFWTLD